MRARQPARAVGAAFDAGLQPEEMPINSPRTTVNHRRLLLGGVSIAALLVLQPSLTARANGPAPLTPSWFASFPTTTWLDPRRRRAGRFGPVPAIAAEHPTVARKYAAGGAVHRGNAVHASNLPCRGVGRARQDAERALGRPAAAGSRRHSERPALDRCKSPVGCCQRPVPGHGHPNHPAGYPELANL